MRQLIQIVFILYLIFLSVVDIRFRCIPFWVLVSGIVSAAAYQIIWGQTEALLSIVGAAVGLLFLGIGKATGESFGYGDGMLIIIFGIALGFWNLMEVLVGAFFLSAITAVGMLAVRKFHRKTTMPFIPFLAVGYLVFLFCGE